MNPDQGMALPHDIEGLVLYGFPWWFVVAVAVAVVAAVLLSVYLFNKWRSRANNPVVEPPVDQLKEAMAQLAALKIADDFDQNAAAQFCYRLTFLFRKVLEEVSQVAATDMTIKELKKSLMDYNLPNEIDRKDLWQVFERADFIKFADKPLKRAEASDLQVQMLNWAQLIAKESEEKTQAGEPS